MGTLLLSLCVNNLVGPPCVKHRQFLGRSDFSLTALSLSASRRAEIDNSRQTDDGGEEHAGLSGRSRAVGAFLIVLLVVLTACLVILLLYKRERR